jgi:opacity protein-like surface antigen
MKWVTDMDGQLMKSKESDNGFGLNLGAGTYFKLTEQFDLHGEIKYIVGKYSQLMFHAGILINLDWLIKNENSAL